MIKSACTRASLIPYPVIAAAVGGNPEAVNRVVRHYSGYIAALLHGESRDECIKTGSAASAICISDFGASNWKVSYEQVRAFAAERA